MHSILRALVLAAPFALGALPATAQERARPDIVVVMTDDQGYGDFGVHGNPVLRTPHLDAMAARSTTMERFYVSPVCAPTRASLMTGRWNYRTGVVDTWIGRAMMRTEEVTVAEVLGEAGYTTGLFGKWHLGDCAPLRPQDQGFDEVLMHRGGGIGQSSDPLEAERQYTNPILFHNGEPVQLEGYCTDLYFDAALDFMRAAREREEPYFAYIATNAPHGPFHDVPEEAYQRYLGQELANEHFPQQGHPLPAGGNLDRRARIYSMIENVDDNLGRLFAALEEWEALEDTLVIFLTDNGPDGNRYRGGLRGVKNNVHEGGMRTPLFAHWPGTLPAEQRVAQAGAHIDLLPTLAQVADASLPANVHIDGRSLLPLWRGEKVAWPERTLYLQTHRGDVPEAEHHFAAIGPRYKLLRASGFGRESAPREALFELYDLQDDPYEQNDLAARQPERVARMLEDYHAWFADVSSAGFAPVRIHVGDPREPEVVLTHQDWREVAGDWRRFWNGAWHLQVLEDGLYDVRARWRPRPEAGTLTLSIGEHVETRALSANQDELVFRGLPLRAGPGELMLTVRAGDSVGGAHHVHLSRTERWDGRVERHGRLRSVLREGDKAGKVALPLDPLPSRVGLGALEGLAGEILIADGRVHLGRSGPGQTPVVEAPRLGEQAALLVSAQVPRWRALPLQAGLDRAGLERAVEDALSENALEGFPTVPFLVRGALDSLEAHVLRGRCPHAPDDPEGQPPLRVEGQLLDALLVGFWTRLPAGALTHRGQRTHVHVLRERAGVSAHLDALELGEGATLFLPWR